MSINSSSFLNITLVPSPLHSSNSSNSSISSFYVECLKSTASIILYTVYTFISVFLLPLYIFILYMGFQRWRYQHSVPAAQPTSHSDFFTYHIVIIELLGVFGSLFYTLGTHMISVTLLLLGMYASCFILPGQTLFHLLTCVERYLAAVHPITYMRLRERGGVRVRNISILCAWLLCFGWMGLTGLYLPEFPAFPLFCMLGLSLFFIFVCCLSVLRVLTHPGPGEVGGNRERVDQSKQRAFYVICAIMGVLLLRFVVLLLASGLYSLHLIPEGDFCVLFDCGVFLSLPSSLVLPLLFLHKTGKLACCRRNAE